jgi:hypothetical protein
MIKSLATDEGIREIELIVFPVLFFDSESFYFSTIVENLRSGRFIGG